MPVLGSSLYWFTLPGPGRPIYISPDSDRPIGQLGECSGGFTPPGCPNWPNEHPAKSFEPETRNFYLTTRELGDFLWYPGTPLLSEKWVPVVEQKVFSGLGFRAVNLFKGRSCKTVIKGYQEMRVGGRAHVDLQESGVKIDYECPICGFIRYSLWDPRVGLHLKEPERDLPDVFKLDPLITGLIFVRPRFLQTVVELKLRPTMFVKLEDIRPFFWEEQNSS